MRSCVCLYEKLRIPGMIFRSKLGICVEVNKETTNTRTNKQEMRSCCIQLVADVMLYITQLY